MNEQSGPSELLRRMLEASANSPLAEADPKSLDELMARIHIIFNKKPLGDDPTTDQDIDDTMRFYRSKRGMFAQLAKERADKEPTKRTKKAIVTSRDIGL